MNADALSREQFDLLWTSPLPPVCRDRLRQILRYLVAHWPPPYPVRLSFHRIGLRRQCLAMCSAPSGFVIEIDTRACYFFAVMLLFHEYAHAVAWDVDPSDHGPAWMGVYADITRAFDDGDAFDESESW